MATKKHRISDAQTAKDFGMSLSKLRSERAKDDLSDLRTMRKDYQAEKKNPKATRSDKKLYAARVGELKRQYAKDSGSSRKRTTRKRVAGK